MAKKRKQSLRTRKRIPTTEKLATALEELNDPKLDDMIKKARAGYYDDYKTTIPFPTIQLVSDLMEMDYPEMAARAKDGEWEAQRWEGAEWFEKEGKALLEKSSLYRGKKGKEHKTV